jgi:hypothetical protein
VGQENDRNVIEWHDPQPGNDEKKHGTVSRRAVNMYYQKAFFQVGAVVIHRRQQR